MISREDAQTTEKCMETGVSTADCQGRITRKDNEICHTLVLKGIYKIDNNPHQTQEGYRQGIVLPPCSLSLEKLFYRRDP